MHELPVVLDIIRVMKEEAQKRGFEKITKINLVIGELSSIVDESVQMYFEVAAKDTPCAKATLFFRASARYAEMPILRTGISA